MEQWTIREFSQKLSEKVPVPGGGGVSALAGALGAALGHMAAAFTTGKKRYEAHGKAIQEQMQALDTLREQLLCGIEEDAVAFLPLSEAYALPSDNPDNKENKRLAIQKALHGAVQPPCNTLLRCARVIDCLRALQPVTSPLVQSDIGCASSMCRACLETAYLNVLINLEAMEDKKKAQEILNEAQRIHASGIRDCESIYEAVRISLCGKN